MLVGPTNRSRSNRGASVALVLALLLSGVALTVSAVPASAFSNFNLTVSSSQPAIAGAEVDVSFRVFNGGPDPSEDTLLNVAVPAGFTPVGGDVACLDPGSCLVGSFGLINPGESFARTVRFAVDPDYVLDNGAGTSSANAGFSVQVDYDGGAQSGTLQLPVGERSDLRIRKYANPPVANAGETIGYGIDVDNLGPSTARTVTIADTLFGGVGQPTSTLTIQSCSYSVSQGGGAITQFNCTTGPVITGQFGVDIGTFVTNHLDPIGLYPGPNPGDPGVVGGRLRASFRLASTDAITLDNEVRVLSATADPDVSNNLAVATSSVEAVADLALTKTAAAPTAGAGDLVTYTLTATNQGPSDAVNVEVADHLPAWLELVSATTPGGVCTGGTTGEANDPVVCRLGRINGADPTSAEVVTITARVRSATPPATVVTNWAVVSSDTPDLDNSDDAAAAAVTISDPDLLFNPVTPSRQFDTRDGTGGVPVGKVPGGTALEFTVTGVNGIPAGAAAVSLNVTIANPESDGYASVYPCATPPGPASNLNFVVEQTVANAVVAPVDAAGKVCFFTTATANIISDVSGWFRPAAGLTTFTPVREFDTRFGTGGVPVAKLAGGSTLTFKVTGVNGVPASGVSAVALNVTVADPDGEGLINVFPCGAQPLTSSLNYVAQQTVPNLVIAPVSPQGTVCFSTTTTTHLLADVSGWFATGSDQHSLNPTRVFDTRYGLGNVWWGPVPPGGSVAVDITGRNGVPESGVGSVVLNVTTTNSWGEGYVTVYPCGDLPLTSNVNYVPGRNVPNAVIAPVSPSGMICFYSPVATDLVVDVSGWFEGG